MFWLFCLFFSCPQSNIVHLPTLFPTVTIAWVDIESPVAYIDSTQTQIPMPDIDTYSTPEYPQPEWFQPNKTDPMKTQPPPNSDLSELPIVPTFDYAAYGIIQPQPITDLDTTWDLVEANGISNDWPPCAYPLPTPFVTWEMAVEASNLQINRHNYEEISIPASVVANIMSKGGGYFPTEGNIRLPENNVISMLLPYYQRGELQACRDENNKPSVYGNGVTLFLQDLYGKYKE